MKNEQFNLINQLIEEQKSLWRIENFYLAEAANKDEQKIWRKLKTQKTKNVAELTSMVKKGLK